MPDHPTPIDPSPSGPNPMGPTPVDPNPMGPTPVDPKPNDQPLRDRLPVLAATSRLAAMIELRSGIRDREAVLALLGTLPAWFGIPAARADYADQVERFGAIGAEIDGELIGIALGRMRQPRAGELTLLAVAEPGHRHGVGRRLVTAVEAELRTQGALVVQVKTLGPSDPSVEYAATRAFYLAVGYVELEELEGIWPGQPCLIVVRDLRLDRG